MTTVLDCLRDAGVLVTDNVAHCNGTPDGIPRRDRQGRPSGNQSEAVGCIQERLFDPIEVAVSVREFVRANLEGFALRQAARAEKRRRQCAARHAEAANDTQACFGFEMTPEERKAQMISFAYGCRNS